jgi:hypothetical protein
MFYNVHSLLPMCQIPSSSFRVAQRTASPRHVGLYDPAISRHLEPGYESTRLCQIQPPSFVESTHWTRDSHMIDARDHVAVTCAEACRTVARLRVEQGAKADDGGVVLSPPGPDTRTFISTFFFARAASASDLLEVLQGLVCGVDLRRVYPASVNISSRSQQTPICNRVGDLCGHDL